MCCCGKPTIKGEPGYSWEGETRFARQVDPPILEDGDKVVFDEPGRCGGIDAHCHHFTVVKDGYGPQHTLLVKHGAETERIDLAWYSSTVVEAFANMSSDVRFWVLFSIYSADATARRKTEERTRTNWASAFIAKRIKKSTRRGRVSVWIEEATANAE